MDGVQAVVFGPTHLLPQLLPGDDGVKDWKGSRNAIVQISESPATCVVARR